MVKAVKETDFEFSVISRNKGEASEQYVIHATNRHGDGMEVIQLYPLNKLYENSLEEHFEPLVSMYAVARALSDTLQSYYNIGKLDQVHWGLIYQIYKPFITKVRRFETLSNFIIGEDWV